MEYIATGLVRGTTTGDPHTQSDWWRTAEKKNKNKTGFIPKLKKPTGMSQSDQAKKVSTLQSHPIPYKLTTHADYYPTQVLLMGKSGTALSPYLQDLSHR
jgi:hypothetical protein